MLNDFSHIKKKKRKDKPGWDTEVKEVTENKFFQK